MVEPKKKLADLQEYLPSAICRATYEFGEFLAEFLGSELTPAGFILGCNLALNDLRTGINSHTGLPIQGNIAGYPEVVYGYLRSEIPAIADAVFPKEFAGNVKKQIKELE